ncbi:MAG: hypothetical protein AAGI45_23565 [Cyanobacteria bacterium P01_H01_bin.26]
MSSSNELIRLAAFAGFSFWTCSFVSTAVVEVSRKGSDSMPTVLKIIGLYISQGFAAIAIFSGVMWLLLNAIDVPAYLFNGISYVQVALLAIFCGTATAIISIVFPNLFLQGYPKKD